MKDADTIARLINEAFLPEKLFIEGERTNPEGVRELMKKGRFLLAEDGGELVGCVYTEPRGERWYLGLLSVDPARQRCGLGSRRVAAAEDRCRAAGARAMDLRIVSLRTELPAFYRRLGYEESGTAPLPSDAPARQPCHFIQMSKKLG